MERGSWEATAWVDNFDFKLNLPWGIRQIYDYIIMCRIARTFDDESLYKLRQHQSVSKNVKMYRTLDFAIMKMQQKRGRMRQEKEYYIRQQNYAPVNNQVKDIEKAIAEEERLINLTPQQRMLESLRETPYGHPIQELPVDWVMKNCKVVKKHTHKNGATYIIYDKVYQHYVAVVYSPKRIKQNGNQGVVFCAHETWEGINQIVKEQFGMEVGPMSLSEFLGESAAPKKKKSQKLPDISHVKKAMGTDGNRFNNNDLDGNGDIF